MPPPGGAPTTKGAASSSSEEDFFGSTDVEAKQGTAEKENVQQEIEKERVGLSGVLQEMGTYNVSRNFLNGSTERERQHAGQRFPG